MVEVSRKPAPEGTTAARRGGLRQLVGRAGWNLVDQMLSSATNAALSILVARQVDHTEFGAFSTAFLLFTLLIAVERALAGQVLSIRHSRAEPAEWSAISGRALGAVASLGIPAGAVLIAAGWLLGGQLKWPLIAVGVTMAPLIMQDTVRSIFFAQGRPALAALNDFIWAVVQFTAMGALLVSGRATVGTLTFTWGASAAVCVALACVQLRTVPRVGAARGWVREHRDLLAYLLPETLITSGGDKVAYLVVGRIVNLGAIGAVNAARQILNPLLIISNATLTFAMPEVSRRTELSARARWGIALGLAGIQTVVSLVYLGVVLLVPDSIGVQLFGDSWAGARSILIPMGLFTTIAGLLLGPYLVIIAMGHAKRTFRNTTLQTALAITLMPAGAVLGGVEGAAWGLLLGKVIEIPFWFVALRTVIRLGPLNVPGPAQEVEPVAALPAPPADAVALRPAGGVPAMWCTAVGFAVAGLYVRRVVRSARSSGTTPPAGRFRRTPRS
jgi:O-antigen/teichoic acid export membrane protein